MRRPLSSENRSWKRAKEGAAGKTASLAIAVASELFEGSEA
jgi:hypothetical protein